MGDVEGIMAFGDIAYPLQCVPSMGVGGQEQGVCAGGESSVVLEKQQQEPDERTERARRRQLGLYSIDCVWEPGRRRVNQGVARRGRTWPNESKARPAPSFARTTMHKGPISRTKEQPSSRMQEQKKTRTRLKTTRADLGGTWRLWRKGRSKDGGPSREKWKIKKEKQR